MKTRVNSAAAFCIIQLFLSLGCQNRDTRSIVTDEGLIAKGEISKDSIYNGLIKFYDQRSNKLVYEGEYLNGKEHGVHKHFFPNGKISLLRNYYYGKLNGKSTVFDSVGTKSLEYSFYFDIPAGGFVKYEIGQPKIYNFHSIDQQLLFHINYDSVFSKKITDIDDRFFHYYLYDKVTNSEKAIELFHDRSFWGLRSGWNVRQHFPRVRKVESQGI